MREWLVTNGLGGYASLTHTQRNTRKFHGVLIASLEPPAKRWIFVSNVYEKIQIKDKVYDLPNLESRFVFDMFPSFLYDINGIHLKKTVFMPYKTNTTIVRYEVSTDTALSMVHIPVITSRHFYDVTEQGSVSFNKENIENGVCIQPDNVDKTLKVILPDASYHHDESWLELHYEKDRERHDSWIDHAVKIGEFTKPLQNTREYYMIFTVEEGVEIDPAHMYNEEVKKKRQLLTRANLPSHFNKLVLSTDNFIVKKGTGTSLIAGYHWFSDWGRDTLISLPGVALVTQRFDDAKNILLSFSRYCKNGLIPNTFMDRDSTAVYNTVDASLWYVDRVFQYLKYTNDSEFLKKIWGTLRSIIDGYKNGTEYGIYMDHDFLISHEEGLTWMDVKLDDYCSTPRAKKAVEIQALWYNALKIMSMLAQISDEDDPYAVLSDKVKENFQLQFDQQYDVIDTRDLSFRPNQIFLASLDFSMLPRESQEKIVKSIEDKLVTVFGLRTLSSDDSRYLGRYLGDYNRDLAYHNGTVWPWLMGPFIKAFVKIKNHKKTWREYAYKNFLQPMLTLFGDQWDGSIPEIFDGDPPHAPRGCISQAWSVAELLRTWVEDIEQVRPPYEKRFLLHEIGI